MSGLRRKSSCFRPSLVVSKCERWQVSVEPLLAPKYLDHMQRVSTSQHKLSTIAEVLWSWNKLFLYSSPEIFLMLNKSWIQESGSWSPRRVTPGVKESAGALRCDTRWNGPITIWICLDLLYGYCRAAAAAAMHIHWPSRLMAREAKRERRATTTWSQAWDRTTSY